MVGVPNFLSNFLSNFLLKERREIRGWPNFAVRLARVKPQDYIRSRLDGNPDAQVTRPDDQTLALACNHVEALVQKLRGDAKDDNVGLYAYGSKRWGIMRDGGYNDLADLAAVELRLSEGY